MNTFDPIKWYERLNRVPSFILENKWHYLSGKIGNTTVTLQKLQKLDQEEYRGGFKYKKVGKKINGIPTWNSDRVMLDPSSIGFTYVGAVGWELYYTVTKTLNWEDHPSWRPICYVGRNRFLESWSEIEEYLSWDGGERLEIYKHPRQYDY